MQEYVSAPLVKIVSPSESTVTTNLLMFGSLYCSGVLLLLWPSILNGYPLVFADSGTYLSQAIRHYVGWDRPAFYSVFLFLMHWKLTTWLAVIIQAAMVIYVMDLVRRCFVPDVPRLLLLPMISLLSVMTPLPWFAGQLTPDMFTSLLTLVMTILILMPAQCSRFELLGLMLFASWMIATHLSNIWIATGLVLVLLPMRRFLLDRRTHNDRPAYFHPVGLRPVMPILLAVLMLCSVNLAAFGRFSVSPFGNVFLLARLVYDGPGKETLDLDCSSNQWRLCRYRNVLPPHHSNFPTSDFFLWRSDGPLAQLGGAKMITGEASQIILDTVEERPGEILQSSLANSVRQFLRFRSGDGLDAWLMEVGPVIKRSFPAAEYRAFLHSRQSRGLMRVPDWLNAVHAVTFWAGLAATVAAFVVTIRKGHRLALLCAAILLCLIGNAIVTGTLSGPHDRYQNRIIWLVLVVPLLGGAKLLVGRPDLWRTPGWMPPGSSSDV